jgi:hypothetical protein
MQHCSASSSASVFINKQARFDHAAAKEASTAVARR